MKKQWYALLAAVVALSFMATGCKLTEEKAKEKYKDAMAKGMEMETYTMDSTVSVKLGLSGMNMDVDMTMEGAVKDKGKTAAFHTVTTAMGQTMESDMYMQGEYLYSSIPGTEKFIKQSYQEATGMEYQQLVNMGNTEMMQSYVEAVDTAENFVFSQSDEDKSIHVSFDFPQTACTEIEEKMREVISASMGPMEDNLKSQFQALGLEGETLDTMVGKIMEAYNQLFNSLSVDRMAMEATMNKKGQIVEQKVEMSMLMDFSTLLGALGETVDEAATEQLKNISFDIIADVTYDNINGEVAVEIPQIAEENIMTPEEAAVYQAA